MYLDGDDYINAWYADFSFSRPLPKDYRLSTNLTLNDTRYPDDESKDIYQGVVSVAVSKKFSGIVHNLGVLYGNSVTQDDIKKSNGKNYYGISLSSSKPLTNQFMAYSRVVLQHSYYDSEYIFLGSGYGLTRREKMSSLGMGMIFTMDKGMKSKLDISYTDNNANVDLYEYHKFKVEASVDFQF